MNNTNNIYNDFIKNITDNNLVLTGSYSYNINFKKNKFKFNDIDFISLGNHEFIDFSKDLDIEMIFNDNFVTKAILKEYLNFEIIYMSLIPKKYVKEIDGIKLVNKNWTFISKIIQLICLILDNTREEKINKVFNDLMLMYNDWYIKLFSLNKIKLVHIADIVLISSSFFWFYKPSSLLMIDDIEKEWFNIKKKLVKLVSNSNNRRIIKIIETIFNNTKWINLLNKIKVFINNREAFIEKYYLFNENMFLKIDEFKQDFDNYEQLEKYITSFKLNFDKYKHCKIFLDSFDDKSKSSIDIRKMMFLTLFATK
ncbi:hypothetical protein FRW55_02475 [Mycoplasma anserisalpingitidis]|uniref:Uncharacterized protein n=1 Tax=Mycoplasma anserisalpingitidis TaxID=519450 RepID=A0A5B8K6Z6_9MOLU|nr:hypothetical protein [Mycoplasma anserisalpingitidis]QDY87014.1 hypothetical protein FRW55_02475 [Mycoplasma anserisalpingitidis]